MKMPVTMTLSRETWRYTERRVVRHLSYGDTVIGIACSLFGRLLDSVTARLVATSNTKLERDIVMIKGVRAVLVEMDNGRVLDSETIIGRELTKLEEKITRLHGAVLDGERSCRNVLPKTKAVFSRAAALAASLYEAVNEVKWALAEHDADVQMAAGQVGPIYPVEEIEKLLADLKK